MTERSAIVLLSGGLDSTTCAWIARRDGYRIHALSFDYGQRLAREVRSAEAVAHAVDAVEHVVMRFDLGVWGGSSLTSATPVPQHDDVSAIGKEIPNTYVPGRNTLFLAFATSFAEARGAEAIFIGVNALDYSGYPDCRPAFVEAFEEVIRQGTAAGAHGKAPRIVAPLMDLTKAGIVRLGVELGVDHGLTWSCYVGGDLPCGRCDSCLLRAQGFADAGVADPVAAASD
ncbi:MAG: 7-cyano-7-deazaguanine synthase QueC [Candidatus Sericytochromatia bacterium]|nr:7-cyano-7-deazaguanine synthase QueC [Candidatus Sericytochromatia bacterium]